MSATTNALRGLVTESVIDLVREQPFDWAGANCIRLARAQAVAMGHDVPKVPAFKSATGALRALKKQGANTTAELLDQWFDRHPAPAFARVGDLVLLPGEDDAGQREEVMGCICISDGRGNLFGWHGSAPEKLSVIKGASVEALAAWKV
jgi:hypothetical protein